MASRPTARAVMQLAPKLHARRLSITGPATYPSAVLTESRGSNNRPLAGSTSSGTTTTTTAAGTTGTEGASAAAVIRPFNTSRSLKAAKDTSTIDFAYFPDIDHDEPKRDLPFTVPVLLSTMYHGVNARAMHEEESESTLRPLIELVAASGTHISMPSAMSEVHDNNAVAFEGIASSASSSADSAATTSPQDGAGQVSDVRQFFNDILDDVLGPKRA